MVELFQETLPILPATRFTLDARLVQVDGWLRRIEDNVNGATEVFYFSLPACDKGAQLQVASSPAHDGSYHVIRGCPGPGAAAGQEWILTAVRLHSGALAAMPVPGDNITWLDPWNNVNNGIYLNCRDRIAVLQKDPSRILRILPNEVLHTLPKSKPDAELLAMLADRV